MFSIDEGGESMPIQVCLTSDGQGVEMLATGVVCGDEIIRANEEIINKGNRISD